MKISSRYLLVLALVLTAVSCGDPQRFTGRTGYKESAESTKKDKKKTDKTTEPEIPIFYAQTRSARDLEIAAALVGDPDSLKIFNNTTGEKLDVRSPRVVDKMVKFSLFGSMKYGWNDISIKTENRSNIETKIFKGDFTVFGIATTSPGPAGASPFFTGWINSLTTMPSASNGKIQSGFQNIVN